MKKKELKIGFAGLTHLGLVCSVVTASKGFSVVSYDNDVQKINRLKNNEVNIKETGLKSLLFKNKSKITFTSSHKNLLECNIIYISLDVQTDKFGKSDLSHVRKMIKKIRSIEIN